MKYRHFPAGNKDLSLLGFGTMRLPLTEDGSIDEPEAIDLIRSGIDRGINYIDTSYVYHRGKSEWTVGKALKDGYREKVYLADKFSPWVCKDKDDKQRVFDKQMTRLDTDYIDLYLLHSLDKKNWQLILDYEVIPFVEELKAQGKIKHIGFSFHEDFELFKEITDYYDWDFCQIQLNYMDKNFQAGVAGLKYASAKGLPVVIMEPLKGGKLTNNIPPAIEKIWAESPIKQSPAKWAFNWVADFPQVMTVLSGMSNQDQLTENLEIFDQITPNSLDPLERKIIESVGDKYNELIKYSCTGCEYCMPCPLGLKIPKIIDLLNNYYIYEENDKSISDFKKNTAEDIAPSNCISCKKCEKVCPQSLSIHSIMAEAEKIFL